MTNVQVGAEGELRQDIITGEWVVIAPGRGKRPHDYKARASQELPTSRKKYLTECPFCNTAKYPQELDVLRLPDDEDTWAVHIFGNKYPAFVAASEVFAWQTGPHRAMHAAGYHEILATRGHNEQEAVISLRLFELQMEALVMRYRQLKTKQSVNYIQIIKNYGKAAGASLEHPHHQIFTTPVLPSDVVKILRGAEAYGKKNEEDVFSALLAYERAEGVRVVAENEEFVVLCPFASRVPFETWVVPKKHTPFFENITVRERRLLAEALQDILKRLSVGLNDPSYNYFIYSAPCDETGFVCDTATFQYFRWHLQIMPRLNVWGGFELGTGLEINTMLPEEAAEYLRAVDTSTVGSLSAKGLS